MVLKGTKRSLRTGNTVRNTRDRQTSSVIVRHVSHIAGRRQTDQADDSYLTADAVEFSLNKKGRWNLPEVIEQNITSATVGDSAVALLRRHRVNRQNDCVSIVTCGASAGDQISSEAAVFQRKKARRKTYCNGLNVLHTGRGKSNKEARKKKVVSTKKDLAEQKQHQTVDTVPENAAQVSRTPEVRYDVFYPLPATSSLRFHPKFNQSRAPDQDSADIEHALTLTTNVKPGKGSHQRYKHVDYDDFYEDDDYYDDWIYGEEDYPEENLFCGEEYDLHVGDEADAFGDSLYSDVMEQAFQQALWRSVTTAGRGKKKPRCRKARRGRFFYSPETENEFDSCLEDGQSQTSTESDQSAFSVSSESSVIKLAQIPSVVVEVSREASSPQWLSEQYGLKYTEAACSPRKIVLEITDRVQAALTKLPVFRDVFVPSLDLTTYLIFTYICPSDQTQKPVGSCPGNEEMDENSPAPCSANVDKYDMFRVQLNMNCMAERLAFNLPEDTKFNDVEDILEQILGVMTTLTPESLVRHPREASASVLKSRLQPDFSTLAEVNGWKASFVSLRDEQAATNLPVGFPHSPLQSRYVTDQDDSSSSDNTSPGNQVSDTSEDQRLAVKTTSEAYCHVCFTEISPGSPQGPSATALAGCGHWFCDGCWQFHLAVSTQEQGSRRLQCPEFRCEAEVDLSTLLSLQPVRDVLVHQRRQVEVQVMRMFLCKWCPNPCCGRVVKLATSTPSKVVAEPTSMTCPCGQRFCFRCHGDPHWPLSCEDFTEYQAALRKRGHRLTLDYAPVVVRGKACPSCRRFIEKHGGCPAMTCLCGFQFWWCCRKPVSSSHACASIFQVNDLTNTSKKVIHDKKPSPRDEPEWLEMAVSYRSAQGTGQVRRDYRRTEQLRENLLSLSAKGVDVGVLAAVPEHRSTAATSHKPALLKSDSSAAKLVGSLVGESQSRPDRMVVAKERGQSRRRAGWVSDITVSEHTRQCIRRTTCGMLKLKTELNSVLENTAAWLHLLDTGRAPGSDSPRSGTVSKVKDIVHDLQFTVASLDGLLGAQGRELTHVLPWFRSLQRHTKDTLSTLAGLLHR